MEIFTYGNKCFTDKTFAKTPVPCAACQVKPAPRTAPPVEKPTPTPVREKPEQVNLKFGKIRVRVTNSKRVRVSQDGTTMILYLDEDQS